MSKGTETWREFDKKGYVQLMARLILGLTFVSLGLFKVMAPVDFLKQVRAFEIVSNPGILNFIAGVLPWCEIVCGLMLLIGFNTRGAALLLFGLLLVFMGAILSRGWDIHVVRRIPFCAIRFDCGCGTGEVNICAKLIQNFGLCLAAALILWSRSRRFQWFNSN